MSRFHRDLHLAAVLNRTEPWDIAIIGGGASGVGAALDAAARGLSVVLFEANDFGKGTSSRSTKLIHGGVRYLRQGNLSLVRESLIERSRLLRNAPHQVRSLEFILPCRGFFETVYYGTGMKLYDWLGGGQEFQGSRRLSRNQILAKMPAIEPGSLSAGISFFDGQFDDSRLLINLVQTAAEHGAKMINGARIVGLHKSDGKQLDGLKFRDEETESVHRIQAKCIVNATGPFCDSVRRMDDSKASPLVTASQGIHLVLPKSFFPGHTALIVPKTRDGRVMFIIPWNDHVLLGTTDTPIPVATVEPKAFDAEIVFLLETASEYLYAKANRSDCLSVFAGIRPLVTGGKRKSTSSLSRDHSIGVSSSGLVTMTGGKWTTYRRMAEDCVNIAMAVAGFAPRPSRTQQLRLHGCPPNDSQPSAIFSPYGTDGHLIERLILDQPELGAQLHLALPTRVAEVIWAVRNEWARSVEDVLARRSRALFLNAKAALEMAPSVAKWMARELGRNTGWQAAQVNAFNAIAKNFLP
jgi:glycerol-3-phosphate dehydrogenase